MNEGKSIAEGIEPAHAHVADGRTILVTGGARGIGRGCVDFFLEKGWNVAVVDLREVAPSPRMEAILGDTAEEETAREAVRRTLARFGRLDALINNAGIANPRPHAPEVCPAEDWNRVIAVNLSGYFWMAKHAAPALREARGAIVNIASTRALMSEPNGEAYAAAKGGVVALTHALAISLGPAVRVNAISPGWIETDPRARHSEADHRQHPVGRIGTPRDIAEAAAYLIGAGFVTGQNLVVDGGMTKKMIYL